MMRKFLSSIAATGLLALPAIAKPDYSQAIKADYDKSLGALWDHFHRNPELSFREYKTAKRMAQELRTIPGMEVTEKVAQTGVVGVLRNGKGSAFRGLERLLLRGSLSELQVLLERNPIETCASSLLPATNGLTLMRGGG